MSREWIKESTPSWDSDKQRIVGAAAPGTFDARYATLKEGERVPGAWWRVEEDGKIVGYGWLDMIWGDAEILLATDPARFGQGIGTFVLDHLTRETTALGLHRLYNLVRPTHPDKVKVTAWLVKKGFEESEDGSLFKAV